MSRTRVFREVTRFRRDDRASVSLELILVMPLLYWTYLGLFVFFDAYRQENVNIKAAFTIADTLSREVNLIDQDYINGLHDIHVWLTHGRQDVALRVSSLYYDEPSDGHVLVWSAGNGGAVPWEQWQVADNLTPRIPVMANGDTIIIVETWATYRPLANVGLPLETELRNFVPISPRFVPQLKWDDGTVS